MADILIRGMEMPKDGSLWLLIRPDGTAFKIKNNDKLGLPKEGAAIFLPEGHGKLIDGHKLYRALFATECGNIAADRDSEGWPKVLTYEAVKKAIQDATIIVPAEGGTKDGA